MKQFPPCHRAGCHQGEEPNPNVLTFYYPTYLYTRLNYKLSLWFVSPVLRNPVPKCAFPFTFMSGKALALDWDSQIEQSWLLEMTKSIQIEVWECFRGRGGFRAGMWGVTRKVGRDWRTELCWGADTQEHGRWAAGVRLSGCSAGPWEGGPRDSAHQEGFCSLPDADKASGRLDKGLGGRVEVEAWDMGRSQHTTQQVGWAVSEGRAGSLNLFFLNVCVWFYFLLNHLKVSEFGCFALWFLF